MLVLAGQRGAAKPAAARGPIAVKPATAPAKTPAVAPPAKGSTATPPAAAKAPAGQAPPAKDKKSPAAAQPQAEAAAPAIEAARDDSGLTALKGRVTATARHQRASPPAKGVVAGAQAAAIAPGPAAQSAASAAKVAALAEAPTREPDAEAFKKALKAKLAELMPPPASAEDAQASMESGTAQTAGAAMKSELGQQQAAAVGDLPAAASTEPRPGEFAQPAPPPLVPPLPGATPVVPSAAGAIPTPLPPAALDTSAERKAVDGRMAASGVSEAQLARANEPGFSAALDARGTATEHSQSAPGQVRAEEVGIRGGAGAQARGLLGKGLAGMAGFRAQMFGTAAGQQSAAKDKNDAERRRIAAELDRIQSNTRAAVELQLKGIEEAATQMFEAGLAHALTAFEAERSRIEEKARIARAEEWSILGPIGALVGYFSSLSKEEVDAAVTAARGAYQHAADDAIDQVATYIGQRLGAARKAIDKGREDAAAFVAALPESVRAIGDEALAQVTEQFDKLAGDVDARRDALVDKLGEKYAEACKAVDAAVEAFREANKSLWDRAKEAVEGVLKTIEEMRKLLARIAAKAAAVADIILDDPMAFLGNLIDGVKKGLDRFTGNFLEHLKKGFFEWLFGQAARAGIEVPKTFDAAGIFGLIASILGLTYANIRARAVAKVGEPIVAGIEKTAEIFMVIKEKGLAGLWDMLVEKLVAMKDAVIEQIQDMLMTEVIKAGVTWLIGLLNPAAAFIKACKAIYEIVMFFINNGRRILEFVDSVLDSLDAIAHGKTDDAASKVEGALARTIPLVIGFIAGLLGLGDIGEKVKKIIERIQAPVNKAIDWVLDKAVSAVKFLGGAVKNAAAGVFSWLKAKAGFKDETGHAHSIYVKDEGGKIDLVIASEEMGAEVFLDLYLERKSAKNKSFKTDNKAEIAAARAAIAAAKKHAVTIGTKVHDTKAKSANVTADADLKVMLDLNNKVAMAISALVGNDPSIAKNEEEKYALEGLTGTYTTLPKPKGDWMTPDHQPQAAILQAAAEMDFFDESGAMQKRAKTRAAQGFAINLSHVRHVAGRTFGSKGAKTGKDFETLVGARVKNLKTPQGQRKAVVGILKTELGADRDKIIQACADKNNFSDITALKLDEKREKELIQEVKARIVQGENQVLNQNLDELLE